MENNVQKLTDAVGKLLTEENKDKSIGEISKELNEYLIEIKDLVESNEISYDVLKDEIRKHMDFDKSVKPGSVAQLLIGCVQGESCPLHKEPAQDVSFIYDNKQHKVVPLTKYSNPISEESYCILYINGDPNEIKVEALRKLEEFGFDKIKIRHKRSSERKYRTLDIKNIDNYIKQGNLDFSKKGLLLISTILFIFLSIYLYKKK